MRSRLLGLGLTAAVILAPAAIPFATASGEPIDVAAIQVDFRSAVEGVSREEGDIAVTRRTLELHRTLTGDQPCGCG